MLYVNIFIYVKNDVYIYVLYMYKHTFLHLYILCMHHTYIYSKKPARKITDAPLDWRSGRGSGCTPPSGRLMPGGYPQLQ